MKRIGLIGVTGYGARHLELIKNLADAGAVELAAAVVINPEQADTALDELKRRNVRVFASTSEMYGTMKGQLDLVVIPAGISAHCPLTLEALANEAAVLVEKPAAGCLADVERMIQARQQFGHPVCVAFQHIYGDDIRQLKQMLVDGVLGGIRRVSVVGIWPRGDEYYVRNGWAGKRILANGAFVRDSPVNNAMAHYANLALFLCGERFEESALPVDLEGECLKCRPEIEMFDTCAFMAKLDRGMPLMVCMSHNGTPLVQPLIQLACEKGDIAWEASGEWRATLHTGEVLAGGVTGQPQEKMYRDVLARLDSPRQFTCSLEIARAHTALVEMMDHKLPVRPLTQDVTKSDAGYEIRGLATLFDTWRRNFSFAGIEKLR